MGPELTLAISAGISRPWAESHEKRIAGAWIERHHWVDLGVFGESAGLCLKRTKNASPGPDSKVNFRPSVGERDLSFSQREVVEKPPSWARTRKLNFSIFWRSAHGARNARKRMSWGLNRTAKLGVFGCYQDGQISSH